MEEQLNAESCEAILVDKPMILLKDIEKSLIKTYKKDIFVPFVKAINLYQLVEQGDKIAVGISGGKDSLLLAKLFQELKRHNKIDFDLVFLSMDPGFNSMNRKKLEENCERLNIPLDIRESQVFHVAGKLASDNPCYLCARMRRGFLYNAALELGCNKLALAHHFDDVIETTLLNMFYEGRFMTMVPKVKAKNFEGIELIRPMMHVKERDVIRWIKYSGIEAMNCGCMVAAKRTSSKRREIKELIKNLRKIDPSIDQNIYTSATNVNIDAILGYKTKDKKVDYNDIYKERSK